MVKETQKQTLERWEANDRRQSFATQNNWILDPEAPAPNYPAALRVEALIEWEKAPVFDQMTRQFLPKVFEGKTAKELREQIVALGGHPGKTKVMNVMKLTRYFQKLVKA